MRKKSQCKIPDRSSPGPVVAQSAPGKRTAPTTGNQGGGDKSATGETKKIRGRDNIVIGTWNVRTLAQAGKLEELEHGLKGYTWDVIGLCEVRWKGIGEKLTQEGHLFYYSGELDKHEHGVGFIVNSKTKQSVLSCNQISSRIMTLRLRAASS